MSNEKDTKKEVKSKKTEKVVKTVKKESNQEVKKSTTKKVVKKVNKASKKNVINKDKILKFLNNLKEIMVKYSKVAIRESVKFLKRYKFLIILNIIIFILTVFIESLYMYKVGKIVWVISTLLFIIIPTIVMCAIKKVKANEIIVSIPIFYVLFLIFLKYCTMRDLYGITSGSLDKIPNFIDAIFVVFAFALIQYGSAKIAELFKGKKK